MAYLIAPHMVTLFAGICLVCTALLFLTGWSLQVRLLVSIILVLQVDRAREWNEKRKAAARRRATQPTPADKTNESAPGAASKDKRRKKKGTRS